MKKLSMTLLSNLVSDKRQQKNMTQQDLSLATGINRALISRLEKKDFVPSISQLEIWPRYLDLNLLMYLQKLLQPDLALHLHSTSQLQVPDM